VTDLLRRLVPDRFILALIATVALASLLPARGPLADAVSHLATGAIVLLFFLHGAKLPRAAILAGLGHWRLHLLILASTYLLFPLLGLALAAALPGLLPPALWTGMLFLCAMPSTVQSSIAFTSAAGGNVPAAIAAASASQLIGVFVTPILVGLLAQAHGGTLDVSGIGPILLQLLVPFLAGHLLRPSIGSWVDSHRPLTAITDRSAILISVYSAFSAAVVEGIWGKLPPLALAALIGTCLLLLALVLAATTLLARLAGFGKADEIAIVFCGSKKSIVTGVPMARVLLPGPEMGIALLPLMIFHQAQLMACAWLAQRYAARQERREDEREAAR
jgi:solute carrier family 10 (sodium/bile acid cotransporter), member 7